MTRRLLPLAGLLLVLSVVLGWVRSDVDSAGSAQGVDAWAKNAATLHSPVQYDELTARLKASGLFPMSQKRIDARIARQNGGTGGGIAGVDAPPFPAIIAASIINGMPRIHLRLGDGNIIAAVSGDTLESGWQLKTVDLSRVLAVYDGEEQEFKVTNYKERESDTAPQKTRAQ